MRVPPRVVLRSVLWTGCAAWASVGCGSSPSDAGADDAGCSYATCSAACEADALCYGSCGGGTCHCTSCGPDADADADAVDDAGRADANADDGRDSDAMPDVETREGGWPGIICRKVPADGSGIWPTGAAAGSRLVFPMDVERPSGRVDSTMRMYDSSTRSLAVVDDLSDVPTEGMGSKLSEYPSLDGALLACGATGYSTERTLVQLRLVDVDASAVRVLAEGSGAFDRTSSVTEVVLDQPWVIWKQVSEETYYYAWTGWVMNIETGDKRELIPRERGVVNLDLLDTTAVLSDAATIFLVDVVTDEVTDLAPDLPEQWSGTITPDWIAWLDQRGHPEGSWFSPWGTEVYGMNRTTREVVPLVTSPGMHGRELDGEGDWLAYTDKRDNPDPWSDSRSSQNIYALHLPTMTEVCVENWPGYQTGVKVYEGVGEMRVLFFDEVSYMDSLYDLWDCNLPTP